MTENRLLRYLADRLDDWVADMRDALPAAVEATLVLVLVVGGVFAVATVITLIIGAMP